MISVDNITVTFGGEDLFTNISFLVNARERIGLVGKNGAGKSTILKILIGAQTPSSGTVGKNGDCTVGYLPQQMAVHDDCSLIEECGKAFDEIVALEKIIEKCNEQIMVRTDYQSADYDKLLHQLHDASERYHLLEGDNRDSHVEKILLGLGFKREEFSKATAQFSGGWRMRIELAKLLLRSPSVFLLDEPTNHLDIESIQWLEQYLQNFTGAVILISHDKAFLDAVTNRTIEISCGKAYDYKVNYSKFIELRQERIDQQKAAFENQQKMIEKTEEFIEKFRYKPTKSNQVQSRIKQLEKVERLEIDQVDVVRMNIKFPPAPRSGQVVVEAIDAGQSFGEKHVFSNADIQVQRGEKIALVGRNGEGKTTFVRQILGDLIATRGTVKAGHNVNIGYFAQNQDDLMDGDFTVYDTLDRVAVGDIRTRLRDILGSFLFRGEDIDKKVSVLSGGERSRLAMARLMLEPYNLLILDEPTNHMDMISKEILKNALKNYDGTVIIISHDREFLDDLVSVIYEFRDGRVNQFLGGIWGFIEKRKIDNMREIERKDVTAETPKEEPKIQAAAKQPAAQQQVAKEEPKLSYAEKKELERKRTSIKTKAKQLEEQVVELERIVADMELKLSDSAQYSTELLNEYTAVKAKLDTVYEQWSEKTQQLENFS